VARAVRAFDEVGNRSRAAISFLRIDFDDTNEIIRLRGQAYDLKAEPTSAREES